MTEHIQSSIPNAVADLHRNTSGNFSRKFAFDPDATPALIWTDIKTLVANTNLAFAIPAGVNSIHVYSMIGTPVFFKVDGAASVPGGAAFVNEALIVPNLEEVRKLQEAPFVAGHTLNLICESAGKVYIEFLYL